MGEEVDIVSIDRMGETSHDFNVKKNVGKVGKKALKKKRGNKKVKKNKSNLGDVRAKSEERKVKIEEKIKLRLDKKEKSIGSVSGIATLRRAGDVTVTNDGNHKIVQSSFHVGPLELEVSKTYGHGKGRVVRTAQASTAL